MTREEFTAQLPELVKNYKPAPDVLNQIKNLEVLMVVGPSGVGKTTLIQGSNLAYVPSDNTRPARPGEIEAEDFYFRSDYDQIVQEMQTGRFVQVAVDSGGDLKSTRANSYPQTGVVVMAVMADVLPIFRSLGFKRTISAFITPPSYDEWMRRLLIHHLSPEQFAKRIDEAKRSLELSLNDSQMHFILNDKVETAESQLLGLLGGNIDQAREQAAKQAAQALLGKVSETTP